ncbi:MAG: S-adenosylmethionine decarboxylase [Dehalococcoidia bacterium]|nr:S-adenosylmethionine decarboxylase [Dehalococcoidia bacterium]
MHLIVDGYGSDAEILQDEKFLYDFLDTYPAQIGMTKISRPLVIRYKGDSPEDWGISGFVFIAESHISVHTFVEPRYVNIDVFSCKGFDAEMVLNDLRHRFKLVEFRVHKIERDWQLSESRQSPVRAGQER